MFAFKNEPPKEELDDAVFAEKFEKWRKRHDLFMPKSQRQTIFRGLVGGTVVAFVTAVVCVTVPGAAVAGIGIASFCCGIAGYVCTTTCQGIALSFVQPVFEKWQAENKRREALAARPAEVIEQERQEKAESLAKKISAVFEEGVSGVRVRNKLTVKGQKTGMFAGEDFGLA